MICPYAKEREVIWMDYKEAAQYIKPYNDKPVFKQKYSISHVQKRFKEIYDLDVVKITGYKYYRYRRYVEYDVYNSDGERIMHRMTLDALAEHLIKKNEY